MAFNYSPKIVTDGLIFYLDAANPRSYPGTGTSWNDLSRSGVNGTLVNGPIFNSTNGGSIVFDGVNESTNLGNNKIGPLLNGSSGITLSSWVNPSSLSGERSIIFLGINSTSTLATIQFFNNTLRVGGRSTLSDTFQNVTYNYTTLNTWINFVGILNYALDKIFIYLNAFLVAEANVNFTSSTLIQGTSTVGDSIASYANLDYHMAGNVAISQIYNRILPPQEILQNYNATKTRFGL
jgi:hypothetical protein